MITLVTSAISGILPESMSGKSGKNILRGGTARATIKRCQIQMKKLLSEDITQERLSWIIECIDEMFSDLENENDTY